MKFSKIVLATMLVLSVATASATSFDFTFTGQDVQGSGELTVTLNGNGSYTAISGTGTETFQNVMDTLTLTDSSANGVFVFDNVLYPDTDSLLSTTGGLLFNGSNGEQVNIWSDGNNSYSYETWNGAYDPSYIQSAGLYYSDPVEFTLSSNVPEPATVALFGLGLLGLCFIRRKSN